MGDEYSIGDPCQECSKEIKDCKCVEKWKKREETKLDKAWDYYQKAHEIMIKQYTNLRKQIGVYQECEECKTNKYNCGCWK